MTNIFQTPVSNPHSWMTQIRWLQEDGETWLMIEEIKEAGMIEEEDEGENSKKKDGGWKGNANKQMLRFDAENEL